MEHKLLSERIKISYLGASFADGWSLPFEFCSRDYMKENYSIISKPVGYLMHNQPPLTWSDDSSLLFCLTESLINGFDVQDIASTFTKWYNPNEAYWSARGKIFDVGTTTARSLERFMQNKNIKADQCGEVSIYSNGNAGLTRSLALAFYTLGMQIDEIYEYTRQVTSITHRHPISIITAFYYVIYIQHILDMDKLDAYYETNMKVKSFLKSIPIHADDLNSLDRVLNNKIPNLLENEVFSSPYCIHCLESSLWSVFDSDSFMTALNTVTQLGEDTDSNAFLTSSISSLIWGIQDIDVFIEQLPKYEQIIDLSARYAKSLSDNSELQ